MDGGVPDWLAGDEGAPSEAAPPSADSGVPDWLAGTDDDTATAAKGSGLPNWLDGAENDTPAAAGGEDSGGGGLPEWIGDDDSGADDTTASSAGGGLPDWLAADDSSTAAPSSPPAAGGDSGGFPSWLAGDDSGADDTTASSAGGGGGGGGLPNWLAADDSGADDTTASSADSGGGLPNWLAADDSASSSESGGGGGGGGGGESGSWLFGDDDTSVSQPGWLRAPDSKPLVKEPEEKKSDWREQLGLHEDEIEDVTEEEVAAPVVIPRPTYTRTPARIDGAKLLKRLAAQPYPTRQPLAEPKEQTTLQRIGLDRVLYVVLAVVLLVGLLIPSITSGLQDSNMTTVAGAANVEDIFHQVNSLSEKDVVLLAYEWDGQHKSELVPLEQAITQHLIARKTHLMLVSTDPQGTMLSFDLRDPMQAAGYHGQGLDYLMLGYRPGGDLALRSMAQNFRQVISTEFAGRDARMSVLVTNMETGEPRLRTINDLSMIIVLADQLQDVQGWMEQIYRNLEHDPNNPQQKAVPMVFLLPSEVAPFAKPYMESPSVWDLTGRQGALSYSARFGGTEADRLRVAQANGQYHFATLIFLVLVLVGGIARAIGSLRK